MHAPPDLAERAPIVASSVNRPGGAWRMVLVVAGLLVFGIGVLLWASPAPGGFLLLAFGLSLVLANSKLAKRRFLTWKRRYPQLLVPLRGLLRRLSRNRNQR